MEPGPHNRWPPGPGAPSHQQPHASPPAQAQAQALPPPAGPFASFHQPHSLASLAGLSQQSPRQHPPPPAQRPEDRPPQPPQGPGYALPSLGQATGQPGIAERERGRERERERAREGERIHIKEEEDRRHREQERQRMEQAPVHQAQQGPPVHLHQPVAVGPPTVHGPNGLLGNPNLSGHQPQPHHLMGAPSGPPNVFAGGPVQPSQPPPSQPPPSQPMQPGLLAPYGPGAQAPPPAQQQAAQAQQGGQQPILNDALSYLDQVKVQFADHPDVYNRFLDIMKDFKSGAIDTPGVIGRVSTLFTGNPDLIQGFNTFLPPGYRIECGAGDDPNSIRVTTPMGTTVSAMPRPSSRQEAHEAGRPTNGTFTPQPGAHSATMAYSPSGRPLGPSAPGQHLSPLEAVQRRHQEEQQALHSKEQRGVSSLQSAVTAAAGMTGLRAGVSPRTTPMPGQDLAALANEGAAQEKRGPVEFNHAISYVNKIKNRFAAHPDIYKQFLEILQTYQRESKPIQDVYSQVTHLFNTAPDLLEDFKQFLPESAAQAKAAERARAEAEVITSNERTTAGGGMYGSPVVSREPHMGTPAHRGGLPPVGNFAPTPASKDTNKRKRNDRQGTAGPADGFPNATNAKPQQYGPGPPGKRPKQNHVVAKNGQPPTSPSLVPAMPSPLPPTTTSAATGDELGFFDKAKKAIGNKNVFNEFLKLCNLFSQDLIDRHTLLFRARSFIGQNADLMKWFSDWLGYDERDIVIENKPRIPTGRVMLSNCRGLGPSYRLLPKRERQKPCSGRDELCNSVLNDDWASHPTWASEDSGFIAHRKNVHEEGLHRIEEERHDYDFNIEAAARTVQLLEPIATQIRRMDDNAQRVYQLPPGLGGQSETIYKRVIMKLYGREKGEEVVRNLHERPYQVVPVILNRVKERLESWKLGQREWEKVWREQTQKMFWKSLDHQAVQTKNLDRRAFQSKTLQSEIMVKHEEMKRAALMNPLNPTLARRPQLEYAIHDADVLVDATHLVQTHIRAQLETDQPKLAPFIEDFVCLFFGLDAQVYKEKLQARRPEDYPPSNGDEAGSVSSRKVGAKNDSLLRTTLDPLRGRSLVRKDREGSAASASRGSTPDRGLNVDPEDMAIDTTEDVDNIKDVRTARWMEHPLFENRLDGKDINPQEPTSRSLYRCWANGTLYCFVRLFLMLYERLYKLKLSEGDVAEAVKNANRAKPAVDLGIVDKLPSDFFKDVTGTEASFYRQMLEKFEDVLNGDLEFVEVEEPLRRFYLHSGYPLYPLEKMIFTLAKDATQVINSDSKEKSAEIYALFKKDRVKDHSTAQQQSDYRRAVEKMVKDAELYRIDYDQDSATVGIYVSKRDDPIANDGLTEMDRENKWRYYIASYTSIDSTDGVDQSMVKSPFLSRNMRTTVMGRNGNQNGTEEDAQRAAVEERALEVKNEEKLLLRISPQNYRSYFQKASYEHWHANMRLRQQGEDGVRAAQDVFEMRAEAVKEQYEMNNSGMKDLSKEDVEKKNADFGGLLGEGSETAAETAPAANNEDVEMEG